MALSVLTLRYGFNSHGLYDSEKNAIILVGSSDGMYHWKNIIEEAQQQQSNKEYMNKLREERIALLVGSGNTKEEAETFLKTYMNYLYES